MLIFCVFNEQKQAVEIKKLHFKSEANWKKYEFCCSSRHFDIKGLGDLVLLIKKSCISMQDFSALKVSKL